jgi:hypothetical protein
MRLVHALPYVLAACSGAVAERPKTVTHLSRLTPAVASILADSASLCWQRFSRGISVESSCTAIAVSPRVDTVRIPLDPPATPRGIPFGPIDLWTTYSRPAWSPGLFSASMNPESPEGIVRRINAARALGHRLILAMTSGKHTRYLTNGKFDLLKWTSRQSLYDSTPGVKEAIAAGVADGTVIGADIMDEPQHPSWNNSVSRPLLDSMAAYVKNIFPTLPVGVSVRLDWRPTEKFTRIDFVTTQYVASYGPIATWRDSALARAKRNGVAVVFSLNVLNGGAGFGETAESCAAKLTGGVGGIGRCRMSAEQLRAFGMSLVSSGCGLVFWKFDSAYVSKPENLAALNDLARVSSQVPATPCRRSASRGLQDPLDAGAGNAVGAPTSGVS